MARDVFRANGGAVGQCRVAGNHSLHTNISILVMLFVAHTMLLRAGVARSFQFSSNAKKSVKRRVLSIPWRSMGRFILRRAPGKTRRALRISASRSTV